MRLKGKSEGKFGVKEGVSINGSNSSSSNNNISMRVIMKSRVTDSRNIILFMRALDCL